MLYNTGTWMIVTGLAAALALAGVQYAIGRQRPKELGPDHGTMQPNHSMIGVAILIAWGVGCTALFFHLVIQHSVLAIFAAFFGIVAIPVLATGFSPIYDISWDRESVTGPASMGFPPFGPAHATIRFEDIVSAGEDRFGNLYVADAAGTCIRWNWFYSGYPELMYFIEDVCPHLFPDPEEPDEDLSELRV
ncbi:MAG: hypothetical protein QNJ16_14630 [Rhodobacter sp.]|nr:hypothetical protein [Rhodobacter sp.]